MSTIDPLSGLVAALREDRPIVLLLGQDAWTSGARTDPVLQAALSRLGVQQAGSTSEGFQSLLRADTLPEDFYEWLAEVYSHQPEPTWMEAVSQLPLNAVFTSSMDPAIARAFRIGGRDVEPVLSKFDNPATPRSRRNLHLTYLFGRAGDRDTRERPPRNTSELRRRIASHAAVLLSRIVETTTSMGILLIDGLRCGHDWLSTDTLFGILSEFAPGQVCWFGGRPDAREVDAATIRELAGPTGPITFFDERLSTALRSLELAHRIDLSTRPLAFPAEGTVTIGDHTIDLEPATRLRVSTAASVIEDTWLAPLPPLGSDAAYAQFRRFHGQVEDPRRLIDGLRRDFAITRTFESELRARVDKALLRVGRDQAPVLIHGQSGSGKSLALARVAYTIRKEARYPVLLASRITRLPGVEELDEFCLKVEEAGAEVTLLICDANVPASRYADLLRGFMSRGRRVVLVGSTYRIIDDHNAHSTNRGYLLEAPAELDGAESNDLTALLLKWTGEKIDVKPSNYLLPAIYRLLPDVRSRLAAGLAREARVAEDDLRQRGAAISTAPQTNTTVISSALVAAGVVDPRTVLDQELDKLLSHVTSDAASKVVDVVMVPGKLGCSVPINLLMRAVGGSDNSVDIVALFSGIDLFRWTSNEDDDLFVRPRLRVEAEMIVARRLGTAQAEAEVALKLMKSANPGSHGDSERRFVLDLVHRLGPDGLFGTRYARHYLQIARGLTYIRTTRGIIDPSFMLQEATLRRRVLRHSDEGPDDNSAAILEEARTIVDLALDEFGSATSRGLRRARANLLVERAAIYGFRAVNRITSGATPDEVWQFYEAARSSAHRAAFAADSYHAIDVSIWVPNDLLTRGEWTLERRAELVADIWDALERVDYDQLDADQQERFQERRVKAGQALHHHQLRQEALAELDRLGSCAGVFLQATALGGSLRGTGTASEQDCSSAVRAVEFLKSESDRIIQDTRCLRYFLRCLWLTSTGTYLFGGERLPLPEQEETIREMLRLLDALDNLEGMSGDPRMQYLRAVLMWRLRQEHGAVDVWKLVSQETAFSDPRRVIRHHVWTEAGSQPKLFHGRIISSRFYKGRARVRVEEIRQDVDLLQRDFQNLELRRGATVRGGFHIAFNFIGPVADPPRRLGVGR